MAPWPHEHHAFPLDVRPASRRACRGRPAAGSRARGVDPRPLRGPHLRDRRGGHGLQGRDRQGRTAQARHARRRARTPSAGWSTRASPSGRSIAQTLALGDDKARGLLLLHGTSDIAENASVDELPVQLHVAEPDPFETDDWLSAWYLQMRPDRRRRGGLPVRGGRPPLHRPRNCRTTTRRRPSTWRVALGFLDPVTTDGAGPPPPWYGCSRGLSAASTAYQARYAVQLSLIRWSPGPAVNWYMQESSV